MPPFTIAYWVLVGLVKLLNIRQYSYNFILGYLVRMRLFGIIIVRFLYLWFSTSVNWILSWPRHWLSHWKTIFKFQPCNLHILEISSLIHYGLLLVIREKLRICKNIEENIFLYTYFKLMDKWLTEYWIFLSRL